MRLRWTPPLGELIAGTFLWGGLIVESNFELPRLHRADGQQPDVRFRWRHDLLQLPEVRERWEWPAADGTPVQMLAGGDPDLFRYEIAGVGIFLLRPPDKAIEFVPADGADPMLVEHTLVNSALPVYIGLQGSLCLHASAVATGGEARLFAGPTGIGKSTLAWRHLQRGWDLVADDAVVVRLDTRGWWLFPGSRTLRVGNLDPDGTWEIRGKRELLLEVPSTPQRLREIQLLVEESPDGGSVATAWRSLLALQSGWRWASAEARGSLESLTWSLAAEVPVRVRVRDEEASAVW